MTHEPQPCPKCASDRVDVWINHNQMRCRACGTCWAPHRWEARKTEDQRIHAAVEDVRNGVPISIVKKTYKLSIARIRREAAK